MDCSEADYAGLHTMPAVYPFSSMAIWYRVCKDLINPEKNIQEKFEFSSAADCLLSLTGSPVDSLTISCITHPSSFLSPHSKPDVSFQDNPNIYVSAHMPTSLLFTIPSKQERRRRF